MAHLKRELGFGTIVLLTVNAIMGTGIFFLPATAAGISGSASLIAWVIMSVIAIFISMYFAELVSMFPEAGGVYEFSKQAFGKLTSFLVGWTAWIVANITMAMLIVGAIQYVMPQESILIKLAVSLALIVGFNYVSYRGVKMSAVMLLFFAVATITVLLLLIIPGIPQVDYASLQPFNVEAFPLLLTIFFIAETFFGWETTTFLAEETKNPRKTLPKALIVSTVIISLFCISLSFVSMGVIPPSEFAKSETPLIDVGFALFGTNGAWAIMLGAFIVIIGSAAGWVVTAPRLLLAMSRDKLFIGFCKDIHPKYSTPHYAILLQTIVTSVVVFIGFGSFKMLLSLLLPLVLFLYAMVLYTVIKLRKTMPHAQRHFSAPFPRVGPALLIILSIVLTGLWFWHEPQAGALMLMGLAFIALGIPFYIAVRLSYDKRFQENFFDQFSWFWDKLFPLWYGKKERQKVLENASIKKGNVVLDYGCFTGMTTKELVRKVGREGTVVAVDVSRKGLEMVENKLHESRENLILIKEKGLLPFAEKTFDAVTLVVMLEHFGDPISELKNLRRLMKTNAKLSALSFGKVYFVPAPKHLKDIQTIETLFKSAGFSNIKIERKTGFLTEYFLICATA